MPDADRHKYKPFRFRPPESDRLWLVEHSSATGQAVNAVLSAALAAYRANQCGPTTMAGSGPTTVPSGPTTEKAPKRARAVKVPPAAPPVVADLAPASSLPKPRRCSHQGKRILGGWCDECNHRILAGGMWA